MFHEVPACSLYKQQLTKIKIFLTAGKAYSWAVVFTFAIYSVQADPTGEWIELGGAPGSRVEIPLHLVVKTMVSTYSLWKIPCWSRWCPKEGMTTTWEAHTGAGSWQDLWPHGKMTPLWSRFAARTCDLVGHPGWSSLFLKDCTPWKRPMLEQLVQNCSPREGEVREGLSPAGGTPHWSRGGP